VADSEDHRGATCSCCRRSVRQRPRHHRIGGAIFCGVVPSLLFIVESPWQAKHCNASTDLTVRIIWLPESANLHATSPGTSRGRSTSPPMGSLGGGGHCRPSPVRPPPRSSTPSIR